MTREHVWKLTIEKGGPGSGHHGHAGRPGKVGGSAPSKLGGGPDADFERAAKPENVQRETKLGGGVTDSLLLELKGDGRGVWKANQLANNADAEVLADRLDDVLGLDVVPKTVLLPTDEGEVGSCQRFVEGARTAMELYDEGKEAEIFEHRDEIERMVLLDYLTGNIDRHYGNVVFDRDGKLWAIDNGMGDDWRGKGGKVWAMDLDPTVLSTGALKLSDGLVGRIRKVGLDDLYGAVYGSGAKMDLNAVWAKIKEIQRTGELRW